MRRAALAGFHGPSYAFVVPGKPVPWKAPNVVARRRKDGTTVRLGITPDATKNYKARVAAFAAQAGVQLIEGPVRIDITLFLARPNRLNLGTWKERPQAVPCDRRVVDLTNVEKAIEDALQGIAYANDAQIACKNSAKYYHERGGAPRAEIIVEGWCDGG